MNTNISILCNGRNQGISTVNMEWGVKKVWIETATRYNILCTVIIQKLSHHNNIIIAALHRNSFRWIENRGLVRCVSNSSLPLSRVCFCQCDIRDFDHRWSLWSRERCTLISHLHYEKPKRSLMEAIDYTCLWAPSWHSRLQMMEDFVDRTVKIFGAWFRDVAIDDVPRLMDG